MKRLVMMTVGKTHSGKTTFAKRLEQAMTDSVVMDQDNHAEFINKHYKKLQPSYGPNTLKHAISELIVSYTIEHTNAHLILCNANRSRKGRQAVFEKFFPRDKFMRVIVHFDIRDDVLLERVRNSERTTNIFRGPYVSFEEVLKRQQAEAAEDPLPEETDYLFEIMGDEYEAVISEIVELERRLEKDK